MLFLMINPIYFWMNKIILNLIILSKLVMIISPWMLLKIYSKRIVLSFRILVLRKLPSLPVLWKCWLILLWVSRNILNLWPLNQEKWINWWKNSCKMSMNGWRSTQELNLNSSGLNAKISLRLCNFQKISKIYLKWSKILIYSPMS